MSKDPVCGEEVTVQRHTPKKLYKGVVYHFCSDACRETFEEDPSDHVRTRSRLGAYP
ncbi:MAG: YHS domain-containing protein [Candidatus Thermoplasmatota archaeon]|nr:YHS domain-containing protein [Candidatus Thermoplasmatota archaeon]